MILAVVVGVIFVYQMMAADIRNMLPEYATVKALGYRPPYLTGVVLWQAVLLAVLRLRSRVRRRRSGCTPSARNCGGIPTGMTLEVAVGVLVLTCGMCLASGLAGGAEGPHRRPGGPVLSRSMPPCQDPSRWPGRTSTHDWVRFALFTSGIGFAVVLMGVQYGIMNAMLDSNTVLLERLNAELVLVNPTQVVAAVPRGGQPSAARAGRGRAGRRGGRRRSTSSTNSATLRHTADRPRRPHADAARPRRRRRSGCSRVSTCQA